MTTAAGNILPFYHMYNITAVIERILRTIHPRTTLTAGGSYQHPASSVLDTGSLARPARASLYNHSAASVPVSSFMDAERHSIFFDIFPRETFPECLAPLPPLKGG